MEKTGLAQSAYQFLCEFKAELLHQIYELNCRNDGELQDGFNPCFVDDGWVGLKGFAWGFVMHFDDPVRIDMTFGPDWPFTGYRTTFVAQQGNPGLTWTNQDRPEEIYFNSEQLAQFGLRRLASKVGDEWIFERGVPQTMTILHNPYHGVELTGQA
jgi:hypothetical protein